MTNSTCILIYSADWAISSTAAVAILAVVCMILIACSLMLLKVHCVGINRDSSIYTSYVTVFNNYYNNIIMIVHVLYSEKTEKEIEMKQNEVYGISLR